MQFEDNMKALKTVTFLPKAFTSNLPRLRCLLAVVAAVGIATGQNFINRRLHPSFGLLLSAAAITLFLLAVLPSFKFVLSSRRRFYLKDRKLLLSVLVASVAVGLIAYLDRSLFDSRVVHTDTPALEHSLPSLDEVREIEIEEELESLPPINLFEGGLGKSRGQFDHIMGIDADSAGNIYAVDMNNHRLQKFSKDGTFIFSVGRKGSGPEAFNEPRDVAVDEARNVYVVDTWNSRIQKFNFKGEFVLDMKSPGGLFGAKGIAVGQGRVYVSDSGNGRIEVFQYNGKHIATWGSKGSGAGEFSEPVGIALDGKGAAYVMDSGNDRIQKLDLSGKMLLAWAIEGWSGGGLKEAYLDCDSAGNVWLADVVSGDIKQYSPQGKLLRNIEANLKGPTKVILGSKEILVSERFENRVVSLSK